MFKGFLAALSGIDIALIVCIVALCVALLTISIIIVVVSGKKRGEQPGAEAQYPIVIYKRLPVERKVEVRTVIQKVTEPAPQPAPQPEEEEVPTVDSEIAAAEAAVNTVVVEDDSANALRYNRSFRARLIQADDELKEWYGNVKNELLSYEKVTDRISWKHESFACHRNPVAKLLIKGKTLCLYLALNPADYADSKYKVEDASAISQFADTPLLYRLKSERRIKYAADLIEACCSAIGAKKTEREPVDYYEPYQGDMSLIKKGLVKRVIEDANTSFIGASEFNAAQDKATVDEDK